MLREPDALDEGGVGDSDQHGDASCDLTAYQLDEFITQPVGQALGFARRAEQKNGMDSAGDEVLRERTVPSRSSSSSPLSGVIIGGMMP